MSKPSPKNAVESKVEIGQEVPNFTLPNATGKMVELSQFKGNFVVLEWYNDGCPFVRKHYDSQNMQKLQKKYTAKKVVWLKIVSSAEGKQGHLTTQTASTKEREEGSHASEILLDHDGKVGKLYHALTTPHMYIIGKSGKLIYEGAIDSNPSYDLLDIPTSKNYVAMALDSLLVGEDPKIKKTRPYGCSIKY